METTKFELNQANSSQHYRADIIAYDREENPVLLVEVKTNKLNSKNIKAQLELDLKAANTEIPFGMLVNLENIEVFKVNNGTLSEPIIILKTAEVLNHYDSEFINKRIFWSYFHTLIEAWLRDLAYNWKSEKPPADEQLAEIGLLQQLKGGTTKKSGVALGSNSLY